MVLNWPLQCQNSQDYRAFSRAENGEWEGSERKLAGEAFPFTKKEKSLSEVVSPLPLCLCM